MNIIEKLKQESKTRKIYVWGAWKTGEEYIRRFAREGIMVDGVIDSKKNGEFCNIKIIKPEEIAGKRNEFFIFVSIVGHKLVNKQLEKYGFQGGRDYLYEGDGIFIQSLKSEFYKDYYGNEINGCFDDCMVSLRACGKITFGNNIKIGKNVKIDVRNFSKLIIGNNVVLNDNVVIKVSDASILKIGDNVSIKEGSRIDVFNNSVFRIYKGTIIDYSCGICVVGNSKLVFKYNCILGRFLDLYVGENAEAIFGKNTTIGPNDRISVPFNAKLHCGEDCMLSYDILVRGNNGHSIFKANEKKQSKENVILGNHVWVGMGSTLMPGTEIGDCSIVGASTLVNKKIPAHSLVVGTPCRILEEDVDWSRRDDVTEEEFMEEVKRRGF